MKKISMLFLLVGGFLLTSCSTVKLNVSDVAYQSVMNANTELLPSAPKSAKIMVEYSLDSDGYLDVLVKNMTDEIMIVDRTQSFFVDTDGNSVMYYDPTVKTTTTTVGEGSGNNVNVNLGAIGRAIGVSGAAGHLLNGVNVGSSSSSMQSVTNTEYIVDQPVIKIAPYGQEKMGRLFQVTGIGTDYLTNLSNSMSNQDLYVVNCRPEESPQRFSVCISFSTDNGNSVDKLVSNFYVNSLMLSYVKRKGYVNNSLREMAAQKGNMYTEPWFLLNFNTNVSGIDGYYQNKLYDYK